MGKEPNLAETRGQHPPSHFTERKKLFYGWWDDGYAKNREAGFRTALDPEPP